MMSDFINQFKQIVSSKTMLIILGILIIGMVAVFVVRSLRMKSAKKVLDEYEEEYVSLKNVPLSFKLNKAIALAKVNEELVDVVEEYQKLFDDVTDDLKKFSAVLAEIDDYIYSKKISKALSELKNIDEINDTCRKKVESLEDKLDVILEQENAQRECINNLKERFRNDKNKLLQERGAYHQSVNYLDDMVKDIEDMFSIFEEWMFASEFNKAADKRAEIESVIEEFETLLNELPELYNHAKVVIPGALEQVEYLYSKSKAKGIYLEHLDIAKHIDVLKENNVDVLSRLSASNLTNVAADIDEIEDSIVKIKDSIEKEVEAFDTLNSKLDGLFSRVKTLNNNFVRITDIYNRVQERFGFESLSNNINILDEKLDKLNKQRLDLENVVRDKNTPFSKVLISCEELDMNTTTLESEVKDIMSKLESACSDEERARKQLIKLQLIVNEIRSKIIKNHLPSISQKYDDDVIQANTLIVETRNLLNEQPLNVDKLNLKLQDAIDYIYTLYNSVNNLIGMATMVENAIVFGNKYRSEFPEVDSELTRAELCFTNGQYTKALKIAMSIIEKLHPGAYEKLLNNEVGLDNA